MESRREVGEAVASAQRLFFTSLPCDAARCATAVREHWGIGSKNTTLGYKGLDALWKFGRSILTVKITGRSLNLVFSPIRAKVGLVFEHGLVVDRKNRRPPCTWLQVWIAGLHAQETT